MRSKLRMRLVLLSSLMLFSTLSGCETTTGSGATDGHASFCSVASPIYWSKDDTASTIEQAKELNAVGVKLCGWGSK